MYILYPVIPIIGRILCITLAFAVLLIASFIVHVLVVSLLRSILIGRTQNDMTSSVAGTATACFSSLTHMIPASRVLKDKSPKGLSTVPEFAIPPGH